MIIRELRLKNFGKFHNKTIELKEGINLIYGPNEAGKSTIHAFIQGMLFGIEKSRGKAAKDDLYSKYEPLDTPSLYHGSMDIMIEEEEYRILRNFNKNEKSFTVTRLDTGRELPITHENYSDFYEGLTESKFINTISIGQLKAKTEKNLSDELRNYITNLSLSKTNEVDITKALLQLSNRKKEIEKNKLEDKIQSLEEKIKEGFLCEEHKDTLTLSMRRLEQKVNDIKLSLAAKKDNDKSIELKATKPYEELIHQGVVIREKYLLYKEFERNYNDLEVKKDQIEKEIELLEYEYNNPNHIKKSLDEIKAFTEEKLVTEGLIKEEDIKKEQLKVIKQKYQVMFLIPIVTLVTTGLLFFFQYTIGGILGFILTIIIGGLLGKVLNENKINSIKIDSRINFYHDKMDTLNKNIEKILHSNSVPFIDDLKTKYNGCILWDKEYKFKENIRKENEYNLNLLQDKTNDLKKEIHSLIYDSGYPVTSDFNEISLNDTLIEEVLTFYQSKEYDKNTQYEKLLSTYEQYRMELERIRWELDGLEGNEDEILKNQNILAKIKTIQKEQEIELDALELSINTILGISIDIHDNFGKELNKLVSNLGGLLTDGKYNNLKVDDKLEIKVGSKDLFLPLSKLSAGTIEQVYLALRLGIANLMFKDKNMPILLDDSFALYDDERTKHALKLLSEKNMGQVLIFTCHNREKQFLNELGINHHFITL
jgi:energy-coupling factor transporter ATP-binding protein EcfA2